MGRWDCWWKRGRRWAGWGAGNNAATIILGGSGVEVDRDLVHATIDRVCAHRFIQLPYQLECQMICFHILILGQNFPVAVAFICKDLQDLHSQERGGMSVSTFLHNALGNAPGITIQHSLTNH